MATVARLTEERDALTRRLDVGWALIMSASPDTDLDALEDFWFALLRQFEACEHWLAIEREREDEAGALVQGQMAINGGRWQA